MMLVRLNTLLSVAVAQVELQILDSAVAAVVVVGFCLAPYLLDQ
jgi:hypothetical protein